MTNRANIEHDSWSAEDVWRWIYRGAVTIVALGLTIAGLGGIIASIFVDDDFWHHILRDIGIAALVSGLVSTAYEYALRHSFIEDTRNQLRKVFKDRYAELDLLHEAGIKAVHKQLPRSQVVRGFETATRIRILQTWEDDFAEVNATGSTLLKAARNRDVDIKILLLKPGSDGASSREKDLSRDDVNQCIEKDIRDLRNLCSKSTSVNDKIQVRLYDATPVMAIHGYDNTNIVGFYWQGEISQEGTQFELDSELGKFELDSELDKFELDSELDSILDSKRDSELRGRESSHRRSERDSPPHFSRAVDKHFMKLWKTAEKVENAKEAPERS